MSGNMWRPICTGMTFVEHPTKVLYQCIAGRVYTESQTTDFAYGYLTLTVAVLRQTSPDYCNGPFLFKAFTQFLIKT